MTVIEEKDDKIDENYAQLQITPCAADPSQNDTTTVVDHSQHRNMTEENNVENPMDPTVQEDNSNTSFLTEQHSNASLRKCFKNAMKADFQQTKNGKWQYYLKGGILF